MNNYIKILIHLRQFADDTELHNIHSFLDDLGLTKKKQKESILSDLRKMEFIVYDGGTKGGELIIDGKTCGEFYEKEFEAKITIEGLLHLKQELEMQKQGSYNFKIEGNNNHVIIESKNVTIKAKDELEDLIQAALKAIEMDDSIQLEIKETYKGTFYKLRTEISENKLDQNTIKEIITIGDSLSSIGSFVLSIINLILT
jgi:hypothetical protein